MASISVDRASLIFRVRQQRQITLKEYLLKRMFYSWNNPLYEIPALNEVSFRIRDGERVGVIGANGSGKSTLLRVLAGIYPPTTGTVDVEGKISSLFDLTLGFEMEANGWKNIRYRGFLQGESVRGIEKKMQEIAEFSELAHFLDLPLRYYSAGMLVRLAFSVSTMIQPEILLIDEVLGAGDLAFQEKAQARMHAMVEKARIFVVVSHDLGTVSRLCNRAIWLDRGILRADGPVDEVIEQYVGHVQGPPPEPVPEEMPSKREWFGPQAHDAAPRFRPKALTSEPCCV